LYETTLQNALGKGLSRVVRISKLTGNIQRHISLVHERGTHLDYIIRGHSRGLQQLRAILGVSVCHFRQYVHLYLIPNLDKLPFTGSRIAPTIGIGIFWLWLLSGLPDGVEHDGCWRLVHGGFWYELYEANTTH